MEKRSAVEVPTMEVPTMEKTMKKRSDEERASQEARFINNYNLKKYGFSIRPTIAAASFISSSFSTSSSSGDKVKGNDDSSSTTTISSSEARKLMRLVDVEALKMKLLGGTDQNNQDGKEVITYTDFLQVCQGFGVAKSPHEAAVFARVLDEAGVVLLFRDKVFLHPHKVVDLVKRAMPVALLPNDDDPSLDELKKLQEKKDELDTMAHKQVRRILWGGLGFSLLQVGLFFRLTFWEFSWDVMEPITFFTTTTGVIIGYAYFLFTSRDPSYQDMMKRLFLRKQRNLIKKHGFDIGRLTELQRQFKPSLDAPRNAKHGILGGVELEKQDHFHRQ
ncbi:Calcium uniporter protein [Heracleum sosnowskyi]|uniref:Calcium uniporter protein n=1 Tax=Heracleum sosnowskyi TaxID=360622 RepID=A0AAD8GTA2_9APIA|nr:Calcium uniporter protein [Heracleum sosnowskyi]